MVRTHHLVAALALAVLVSSCLPVHHPEPAPRPVALHPDDLPPFDSLKFTPPPVFRTTLPNGITLFVLTDNEQPIVNVDVLIRGGSQCDPAGKPGVASFTAGVMRRGGTLHLSADALDDTLDYLAAHLNVGMDVDCASANLNVLRKDFDSGLAMLADVLIAPAFPENKIVELQRLTKESIRRRNDDPYEIGRRRFRQIVYGQGNPWARQLELEDVDRITREDLVAFHRTWFRPNVTYMAISGDVTPEEAVAKVNRAFAAWPPAEVPPLPSPEQNHGMPPGVYHIQKTVNQSAIRMGSTGLRRHDPDQYAVAVMNQIFGAGTFTSRLGQEVRSNRGLAYYVFGIVLDSPDPNQGMFLAAVGTRADKTSETISVMRSVIDSMSIKPVTDDEISAAKETIINSFVFSYASPERIAGQEMRLVFDGYPEDYLTSYIPRIRSVTKDDVVRVARKYLRSNQLRVLVVGDSTRFDGNLGALGPFISLPPDDPSGDQAPR